MGGKDGRGDEKGIIRAVRGGDGMWKMGSQILP